MSRGSSSSDGVHGWPRYGPVPLTRCPECPRLEPLVRLRCKRSENGNYGREFVKCESKPQLGKILKKCTFFMWMDEYMEMLQLKGMMKEAGLTVAPESMVSNFRDEQARADVPVNWDLFVVELKKINGNLSKIIDLKKQELFHFYFLVALYVSMIFMGMLLLMMKL